MKKIIGIALIVVGVFIFVNQQDEETDLGEAPIVEEQVRVEPKPEPLERDEAYQRGISSIRYLPEILDRARVELRFLNEARKETQKWFAAMASINVKDVVRETVREEIDRKDEEEKQEARVNVRWMPEERQVILFFYEDNNYDGMVKAAQQLSREGHVVYRAPPERYDLYAQFDVDSPPLWLVIRDGEVIYRYNRPPTFPAQKQRQTDLDAKHEAMSRALQRRDSFGIQHITPGTGRYQTQGTRAYSAPSCSSGVCSW